jgi:imidazolonepropionase-like amidohydrolase
MCPRPALLRVLRLVLLSILAACAAPAATTSAARSTQRAAIAFVDVRVVSMVDEVVRDHQTVVVEGGVIARVGPAGRVAIPAGAVRIAGAGRTLVPGFADMHVHLPGDDEPPGELDRILDLSLASGVTTLRGMQGAPGQLALRDRLRTAGRPAPTLVLAGPPIAGPLAADQARALVRDQQAAGYDAIKILGGIDLAVYRAIAAEASRAGIPVCGHVPQEIGIEAALAARQSSIEHLMGYDAAARAPPPALDDLARRTRTARVWNCPTLDFFAVASEPDEARLSRRAGLAYAGADELAAWRSARRDRPPPPDAADRMRTRRAIAAALARAGAPLLVGSDAPGPYSVPGFAYLEELRELHRSGLGRYDVLRAATRSAADYLGQPTGAIAVGMRADLVLLDGNPLDSLEHLARPAGVMVRGAWLSRRDLDRLLARHRPSGAGRVSR